MGQRRALSEYCFACCSLMRFHLRVVILLSAMDVCMCQKIHKTLSHKLRKFWCSESSLIGEETLFPALIREDFWVLALRDGPQISDYKTPTPSQRTQPFQKHYGIVSYYAVVFLLRPQYLLRCEPFFERRDACKTKEMMSAVQWTLHKGVAIASLCAIAKSTTHRTICPETIAEIIRFQFLRCKNNVTAPNMSTPRGPTRQK